jgi:hypothetical protein
MSGLATKPPDSAERGRAFLLSHLHNRILVALNGRRFELEDEKRLQSRIAADFVAEAIDHAREVPIIGGTIDFVVWSDGRFDTVLARAPRVKIGIEVKLRGATRDIERQLARYAAEPSLDALLLLTAKPFDASRLWHGVGKPIQTFDLGRAWL